MFDDYVCVCGCIDSSDGVAKFDGDTDCADAGDFGQFDEDRDDAVGECTRIWDGIGECDRAGVFDQRRYCDVQRDEWKNDSGFGDGGEWAGSADITDV
jgi:hypothetical protein